MCHVFPVEKMVTFAPFGVADLLQVAEVCQLIFLASIYLCPIAYYAVNSVTCVVKFCFPYCLCLRYSKDTALGYTID